MNRLRTFWDRTMQTAAWVKCLVFNPPLEWVDAETHEVTFVEKTTRRRYATTFRPMWMTLAFTTSAECGCRRRFGLWKVLICMEHAGFGKDEA